MADGSLIFDTRIDQKGFQAGLKKLSRLAVKTTAVVGAGFAALSGYAGKVGSSFESSMSEVAAISGAAGKQLQQLSLKAKEMGATTKFSASQSAEALKYMAMAGWDTKKMLDGLPGVMNLAAASGEELATVSDIVTDAMTAFGLEASQAGHFSDVLAQASSKSNTNVALLGESFKYVAPLAGALGFTAEDTAIALGLMANAGIKGSQSGTSLKTAIANLASPTNQMQEAMSELGISITDSSGQMKPLKTILDELRTSMQGLDKDQQSAYASTIFGKEAMSGMLAIINASSEDYNKLSQSIYNSTGAAQRMADVMMDNLNGDIQILHSTVEALGIQFYDTFDTQLRGAVQSATSFISNLVNSMKSTNDIREELINAGASMQEVNAEMATMANQKGGVEGLFDGISESISNMANSFVEHLPMLLEEGQKITQNLVAGVQQNLPAIVDTAAQIILTLANGVVTMIPNLIQIGADILVGLMDGVIKNSDSIVDGAGEFVITLVQALIDNIPKVVDAGIEMIKSLAMSIIDNLPQIIETAPRLINDFADTIYNQVPKLLKAGLEIIVALAKGLIKAIPTLIANLPQIILAIVNVFTLYNWANLGKNMITKIKDGAIALKNNIVTAIKEIGTNIVNGIRNLLNGGNISTIGRNLLSAIRDGAIAFKDTIINGIRGVATGVIDGIRSVFNRQAMIEIGSNLIRGIAQGIKNTKDWIWGIIKGFCNDIVDGIKGFFGIHSPSRVMDEEVGQNLGKGIAQGLSKSDKYILKAIDTTHDRIKKAERDHNKKMLALQQDTLNKSNKRLEELGVSMINERYVKYGEAAKGQVKTVGEAIEEIEKALEVNKATRRDNQNKARLDENKKILESEKEVLQAEKKNLEEYSKEYEKVFAGMRAEYEKAYDAIINKQHSLADKLKAFGDLIEKTKTDAGVEVIKLADVNKQISTIEQYGDTLDKLKERGTDIDVMNQIMSMGIEEAVQYGSLLLQQSDSDFESYMKAMEKKRETANEIAKRAYQNELATLKEDYTNRLSENLGDIPEMAEGIGAEAGEKLGNAFGSTVSPIMSEMAKEAMENARAVMLGENARIAVTKKAKAKRNTKSKATQRETEKKHRDDTSKVLNRIAENTEKTNRNIEKMPRRQEALKKMR